MKPFRFTRILKALAILFAALTVFFWANHPAKAPVDKDISGAATDPPPAASVSRQGERVASGCEIVQTMGFTRCGHSVTRRIEAPESVLGADFSAAQAYYALWQIDSFSGGHIAMSREIPLFCPMHTVVSVNDAGNVVLCQNVYGDGMAVVEATELSAARLERDLREELLLGVGFDTKEEAEAYLAGLRGKAAAE